MRIAKAVEQERWHKVAALSRILTRSYYAKLWAVRRVVTNKGKNTAGVDRVIWKTPKQKVNAVKALLSVITIIDVVMFTLFDGISGDAERECSDRVPCRSWC
jgi:hypothetical protein